MKYVELLLEKNLDGKMGFRLVNVAYNGKALDAIFVPFTREEILAAWDSVEKDGIPWSFMGLRIKIKNDKVRV